MLCVVLWHAFASFLIWVIFHLRMSIMTVTCVELGSASVHMFVVEHSVKFKVSGGRSFISPSLPLPLSFSLPPPPLSSRSMAHRPPESEVPFTTTTTTHPSTHHPSHTHIHQVVPSHPRATIGTQECPAPSIVPAAYQFAPTLPVTTTGTQQEAFSHHPSMSHDVESETFTGL